MSIFDGVKEQWGPLPVWAWGAIGGVVILGGYYLVKSVQDKSAGSGIPQRGYSDAAASLGEVVPAGVVTSVVTDVETNNTWVQRATRYLSDNGYDSADVSVWLTNYVTGIPVLGSKGKAAVSDALNRFGTPPDLSFGVPTFTPDPGTVVDPSATLTRYIRKASGAIAAEYSDGTISEFKTYPEWKSLADQGATFVAVSDYDYNAKTKRG